jgi:hypothetical protein
MARAVAIDTDGGIVVVGGVGVEWSPTHDPRRGRFAVLRYEADGVLDPSFAPGGLATTAFGQMAGLAYALALDTDGSIVIAGTVSRTQQNGFAVAKYVGNARAG